MKKIAALLAASVLALCSQSFATTYYADPAKGSADNDGSQEKPWKTLEEVVKDGKLKTLKGGDTLLLAEGYHGAVSFSGENDSTVTIAAAPGARPKLSRLTIPGGKNWDIKGLVISPSFGKAPYKGEIVSFGDHSPSSKITIEDCYIFTEEDSSNWDAQKWMSVNSGIVMGRNGTDLTLRNNYIRNVRFGISLEAYDSMCEGNVVSNFSGDAMRITRDGETAQYNILKNCYVSAKDGDKNHDDGIQCFLFNKGTGLMKNVKIIGNIVIAHEDPDQKLKNDLQGISGFDGPLQDFVVTDNVVNVDAFHGLSWYDAINAHIERNTSWSETGGQGRSWIMLGSKPKVHASRDNTVKDNYAGIFNLKQPGTVAENNKPVTEAIYKDALKKLYKTICDKYGEKHFAANREKLEIK